MKKWVEVDKYSVDYVHALTQRLARLEAAAESVAAELRHGRLVTRPYVLGKQARLNELAAELDEALGPAAAGEQQAEADASQRVDFVSALTQALRGMSDVDAAALEASLWRKLWSFEELLAAKAEVGDEG